jgi:hypothetical protein
VQNDWISLRHVGGLAGLGSADEGIYWLAPFKFVAVQCGLWLVFWFIVWVRAMLAHAPWKNSSSPMKYLWWMSAPMFAVFLAFSPKTDGGEPNWPVTAYFSGLVLGILWLAEELRRSHGWYRRSTIAGLAAASVAGVVLVVFVHYSTLAHPLLTPFAGPATPNQPFPLRRLDPTLRLRGWRELAYQLDDVRRGLLIQGETPVLTAAGWSLPGLLGFYCENHPPVYSLGLALGDRRSQYDLWRPNPIRDVEEFAGKTFIVIGCEAAQLRDMFVSIETRYAVTHLETGQVLGQWAVLVCRGYRGTPRHFDPLKGQRF